jgi:hypothetical protein
MGHVFFRSRESKAALARVRFAPSRRLVVGVLALALSVATALAVHTGSAKASTCTVEANCVQEGDNAHGTISKSSAPQVTWQGQAYTMAFFDPSLCFAATDPESVGNTTCDHFLLTTQDAGTVGVIIQWPDLTPDITADDNDFDLVVCIDTPLVDNTPDDHCTDGNEVAFSMSQNPTLETVTFTASAGVTYDVRVIPSGVVASDYTGCAAYTSAQNACPQPIPSGTSAGGTASMSCQQTFTNPVNNQPEGATPFDRRINGGAEIGTSSTPTDDHFSLEVSRKTNPDGTKDIDGKVNWKRDTNGATQTLRFKSTEIDCVSFFDGPLDSNGHPTGDAEIRGIGKFKDSSQVSESTQCFRAWAHDGGEPGAGIDRFEITFVPPDTSTTPATCKFSTGGTGTPITNGNIDYHLKA